MEAEARYTWVGAGVLVLLAALLGSLVWLKGFAGKDAFDRYTIHFEQQALDGLEIGADVSLRGIRVGRVEDYKLAAESVNRVRVDIRVDRRAPVRSNTVAVVTRNLVTGIAAITLVTPEPPGAPLTAVPQGERFPVIGEGRSDLQEIAGRVSKVGEAAGIALANLNQLLAAENRDALMATVKSLRELADGVRQRLDTLDRALAQVGAAAAQVGGLAGPVATAAADLGRAGERVAAVAERGGEQLGRTLGQAEVVLADARRAIDRLAQAGATLQRETGIAGRQLQHTAQGIDDQVAQALAELRVSTEAAARVIDRLRDPRAALLGPSKAQLGPGEGP